MSKESRIALLAIASLAILIIGYKFIIGKSILAKKQYFYVKYKDIDQLAVSNPVLINGYKVGAVNKIYLDPTDNITPVVELEIKNDIKIPKDAKAYLVSLGVMGGKAVKVEFKGICEGNCAKSGDYLESATKSMLSGFISDEEIEGYTEKIKNMTSQLFDSIAGESGKKEIKTGVQNFEKTLANLAQSTTLLNNLMVKNSHKLDKMIGNLESVVANIQSSNKEINRILKNADTISNQIKSADASKTIAEFNATLKESKSAIQNLQQTLQTAEKSLASVNTLIKKVESGDGTAAKIINDPALYKSLTTTSKQLELLLQDLRLNPKRYINVSVFGKKQKNYIPSAEDPVRDSSTTLPVK